VIRYYKTINGNIEELDKPEKGSWLFFIDSIDIDERSRFESENDIQYIVLNAPSPNPKADEENEAPYITFALGIIEVNDYIITVSSVKNKVLGDLAKGKVAIDTENHSNFVLKVFDRANIYYLQYLKDINLKRNSYEKELYNSSRNAELSNLMNIQKSLVYFLTNLRANELMMMKVKRTDFLEINGREKDIDLLDDIIVDTSQALEMSDVYTRILNGTMDAFASIISNNLNSIMRRLTAVTIVLMVPTLIASFYGMNVPVPAEGSNFAFAGIILFSILISIILVMFFTRKRLF